MATTLFYKLIGKLPVPCSDETEWAKAMSVTNRTVGKTYIGVLFVSTVFLGIDHSFGRKGDPILFETMIFDENEDNYQTRCGTWDEAERMHAKAVEIARERIEKANISIRGAF